MADKHSTHILTCALEHRPSVMSFYNKLSASHIYGHPAYIDFLEKHYGDVAIFYVYEEGEDVIFYPFFRRSLDLLLGNKKFDGYVDIHSSWYYGGPLTGGAISAEMAARFRSNFSAYCRDTGVVTEMIRFDANLQNHLLYEPGGFHYDRQTVFVDLTKEEAAICAGFGANRRKGIRKATELGIEIIVRNSRDQIAWEDWAEIYNAEMIRKDAPQRLRFDAAFFNRLRHSMADNVCLLTAMQDGAVVGGLVVLYGCSTAFFYLAASRYDLWDSRVNDLMYSEAILWSRRQGLKIFDFMGGRPNVLKYKSTFSSSRGDFFVRKEIVNQSIFDAARELYSIDETDSFFPPYLPVSRR